MKEDQEKMQKVEKRNSILEEVTNNVRVLNELLANFDPETTTADDLEMMKVGLIEYWKVNSKTGVLSTDMQTKSFVKLLHDI